MKNYQMYRELSMLRQSIKEHGRRIQGRAPTVCSDEALFEIAEMCPKKLSDFEGIPGIGKSFIDNYGEQFLKVILRYQETDTEKAVNISSSTANTLKELGNKLVNINRRNRLLYMPKIANKFAFDLFACGKECAEKIIFGGSTSITVCDISEHDTTEETKGNL